MKGYIISIIAGFVLIGIGIGFLVFEVMDYDYVEVLPTTVMQTKKTYNYDLNDSNMYFDCRDQDITFITDDSVLPGTVKVEVSFYDQVKNIKVSQEILPNGKLIRYLTDYKLNSLKYFYNFTIKGLKDKKVYNYYKFDNYNVKVYTSSVDAKKVYKYDDFRVGQNFYIQDETVFCPQMLEEIARDEEFVYYLNCIKSNSVYLIYENGPKISVRAALNRNTITIEQLLDAGLSVIKDPINNL